MPEAEHVQQSFLGWMLSALGAYALLLPLAGLATFILAIVLVWRGKGPMAPAALLLIVHIPVLIGAFASIQGMISAYTIMAMSAAAPKPSELAAGWSTAMAAAMVGLLLTAPGYLVAAMGALVRAMLHKDAG